MIPFLPFEIWNPKKERLFETGNNIIYVRFHENILMVFFSIIQRENMEYEEKFNDGTILALKATVEGPRRILLVATEDSPLCIRDAMNGLHLRVMASFQTFGVLSLIIHKNFIYCGTNSGEVLVLSFHVGIKRNIDILNILKYTTNY